MSSPEAEASLVDRDIAVAGVSGELRASDDARESDVPRTTPKEEEEEPEQSSRLGRTWKLSPRPGERLLPLREESIQLVASKERRNLTFWTACFSWLRIGILLWEAMVDWKSEGIEGGYIMCLIKERSEESSCLIISMVGDVRTN